MKLLHSFISIIPLVSAGSISSKKPDIVEAGIFAQTLDEIQKCEIGINTENISTDNLYQIQTNNSIFNQPSDLSFGYDLKKSCDYIFQQSLTETEINSNMRMTDLAEELSNMKIAKLEYENEKNTLLENCNHLSDKAAHYKDLMEQLKKQLNEKQTENYETADDSYDLEEEKNVQMKIKLQALQAKLYEMNCDKIQVEKKNNILNIENDDVLKQIENLRKKLGNNMINTMKNENLNIENMDLEKTCKLYWEALQKKDGEIEILEMKCEEICKKYIKSEEEKNILYEEKNLDIKNLKKALRNEEEKKKEELLQEKIFKAYSYYL